MSPAFLAKQSGIFVVHHASFALLLPRVAAFLVQNYGHPLVPNSLHVFEQNFLTAAVIEFRGPAVGVTSDSLGGFQGAVILQKIRDAGRPE